MNTIMSISLVGVGGQGILLTSDVLARTAALAGLDVKKSEVHGMAQRGGSVISQVRFGPKVHGPIVPDGESDILVAFERLEALRWRHLLAPDGRVLINRQDLAPVSVSSGQQPGVADMDDQIRMLYPTAVMVDASRLAAELGQVRATNMVLAGALSRFTPFEVATWHAAMQARIPARLLALNLRAFDAGRACVEVNGQQ
jgi:indolepyruvate ferredoxin oxidoreductase, beta subunit